MATYSLPTPPAAGVAVDTRGITWRHRGGGRWHPDSCPTCGGHPAEEMEWPQLCATRGPLTDPPSPAPPSKGGPA